MALRRDLKSTVTIYSPDGKPEDHTVLNARDLQDHAGYTLEPRAEKAPEAPTNLPPKLKLKTSPEQAVIDELLAKPVDTMTKEELQAFALEAFGTAIDKRLTAPKAFELIQTIAGASNYKLKLSTDVSTGDQSGGESAENGSEDKGDGSE